MRFIIIILLLQLQLLARCQTSINNYNQLFAKDEESLSFIYRQPNLYTIESLRLEDNQLAILNQYDLNKFTKLTKVKIGFHSSDGLFNILAKIAEIPNIKLLEIEEYPLLQKDTLKIKRQFPLSIAKIQSLEAIKFTWIKNYDWNDTFEKIAGLPKLKYVNIHISNFYEVPQNIANIKTLEGITIAGNSNVAHLPNCLINLNKLTFIGIDGCDKIDFNEVFKQLNNFKSVNSLYIGNSTLNYCDFTILKRVTDIQLSNITSKNWSSNLSAIFTLQQLTKLSITTRDSITVPSTIKHCKKLQSLSISGKLQFITPQIVYLSSLSVLNLSNNAIKSIPTFLYKLKHLEILNLARNKIDTISDEIQTLKRLKYLNLSSNLITSCTQIGTLKKLEYLDLSYNKLVSLPVFLNMKKLVTFNISNNSVSSLNNNFINANALQLLLINNNKLTELPSFAGKQPQLHYINSANNQLHSLPKEIGIFPNIDSLNFSYNKIENIPSTFAQLKKLKYFDIDHNLIRDDSSFIYIQQASLVESHVIFSNNGITNLPSNNWEKSNIKWLNITRNNISKVPVTILQAPKLLFIDLYSNKAFNKFFASKEELAVAFVETGELPLSDIIGLTPAKIQAIKKEAYNQYQNKNYRKALFYFQLSDSLSKYQHLFSQSESYALGIIYYNLQGFNKSIVYLKKALDAQLSSNVRIMNSVNPNFEYLIKAYWQIKDTSNVVNNYKKWADEFNDMNALSYYSIYQKTYLKDTIGSFTTYQKAISNYYASSRGNMDPLTKLSILELHVIQQQSDSIVQFTNTINTEKFSASHHLILNMFNAIHQIINNQDYISTQNTLLDAANKAVFIKTGWSYELFENWLNHALLKSMQKADIKKCIETVKTKVHN